MPTSTGLTGFHLFEWTKEDETRKGPSSDSRLFTSASVPGKPFFLFQIFRVNIPLPTSDRVAVVRKGVLPHPWPLPFLSHHPASGYVGPTGSRPTCKQQLWQASTRLRDTRTRLSPSSFLSSVQGLITVCFAIFSSPSPTGGQKREIQCSALPCCLAILS